MNGSVPAGPLLAIDTATAEAVVAIGAPDGTLITADRWVAGFRHGEELIARISALLTAQGLRTGDLGGVVVGTGPGAFTGLRVGLATAKTLAHAIGRPIVGISSGAALLSAAAEAGLPAPIVLLLPAGPSDRVLVTAAPMSAPRLIPAGIDPELEPGTTVVAVDLDGRADPAALLLGERVRAGLGSALLREGARRLAADDADDVAMLVPEYVTLPRGVRAATGAMTWSHDPR